MSVRRAQMEVSSLEFTEWMAYYELEPFGEIIADLRHGGAVAMLANVNRDSKVRPELYTADDFIYWRDTGKTSDEAVPVLLADPVAQGNLMRAVMFGKAPE